METTELGYRAATKASQPAGSACHNQPQECHYQQKVSQLAKTEITTTSQNHHITTLLQPQVKTGSDPDSLSTNYISIYFSSVTQELDA